MMDSESPLLHSLRKALDQRQTRSARRRLTVAPPEAVDFSSNDFLSLSKSKELRTCFLSEFANCNDVPLGSGGSRLLDGNYAYTEALENEITQFHNASAGLLFNSGYDANSGIFSCLPQPEDVIIYDEFIHASVHEGMRLSRTSCRKQFSHNCVQDFRRILEEVICENELIQAGSRNVFVAIESVYSMDGDVAPIREIVEIVETLLPRRNGHIIIDEAHSTGVYGAQGRGIVCELGLENRIFVRLHTFGKALSSGGAIVLCAPIVRDYLINYARSLIYTTASGLPSIAMVRTVYRFMKHGRIQRAQSHLWWLIHYLQEQLLTLPLTARLQIRKETPKSPIFAICTPHPRALAKYCQDNGFIVRPIVPPTVPAGGERVRVCLHSGNTKQEIDALIRIICDWIQTSELAQTVSNIVNSRL